MKHYRDAGDSWQYDLFRIDEEYITPGWTGNMPKEDASEWFIPVEEDLLHRADQILGEMLREDDEVLEPFIGSGCLSDGPSVCCP